jgi:cytochrome c553
MKTGGLRLGEKVLFGIAAAFVLFAVVSFVAMEIYRAHSGKKMYAATSHYDFSPEGLNGSQRFRDLGCTSCHRAVRNGTNNGVNLDGIGSRRSLDYLNAFMREPEATYGTQTLDHGAGKGAAYVAQLSEQDLHSLAVFLSELKATQGSPDARLPVEGRSGFIDEMVKIWAPSSWKSQYHDVREEGAPAHDKDR